MKKPYLYLIALLLLTGCDQEQKTEDVKDLPKNEAALIKQFNIVNDKLSNEVNKAGEKGVIDSGAVHISNFVKKDLNLHIEKWHAYVEQVTESTSGDNVFDVNVFIPLKGIYRKEHPTVDAITLKCRVTSDNKNMMPIVKTLQPFDKVIITGAFEAMENGDINFTDLGAAPDKYDFSNPQFKVTLEGITKL